MPSIAHILEAICQCGRKSEPQKRSSTGGTLGVSHPSSNRTDGDFTSRDLVHAFGDGGYEAGPLASAESVPEPDRRCLVGSVGFERAQTRIRMWSPRRAVTARISDIDFLPIKLEQYVTLVDTVGWMVRSGK